MNIRRFTVLLIVAIMAALLLVACSSPTPAEEPSAEEGITVAHVQANMTLPSETGSFWMEITNNSGEDDALVGAEVDGCGTIELHDMVMDDDVMVMRQVEGGKIPVPAGETVMLKKGGLHVMCIGKEAPLEKGTSIDIALQFENAGTIDVTAKVVEPGEMPMGMDGEGHSGMEMEEE